jgi:diacylglycerol kinase (ATP)
MIRPPDNYFLRTMKSFGYATKGILFFFSKPSNAWIHLGMALLACLAGYCFRISQPEWIAVIFAIAIVVVSEMLNTAIELLTDLVSPEHNELAGKLKDVAAGAVLVASIAAAIVGAVIFLPKIG